MVTTTPRTTARRTHGLTITRSLPRALPRSERLARQELLSVPVITIAYCLTRPSFRTTEVALALRLEAQSFRRKFSEEKPISSSSMKVLDFRVLARLREGTRRQLCGPESFRFRTRMAFTVRTI